MQPAAIERRQDVRDPIRHGARVLPATIEVLDLCSGGAVVETKAWLAPGRRHCLELTPGIFLTGTVTTCALARLEATNPPRAFYKVGFQFDPPTPESRRGMMRLIAALRRLGPADPLPTAMRIG